MNVNDMFPSKYLKGLDLQGQITVTIAGVKVEKMYKPGEGQSDAYVLICEKATKGVILTKTLAHQIAVICGSMVTDDWKGKRVTLYPEPMTVAGRDVVAIRARPAAA